MALPDDVIAADRALSKTDQPESDFRRWARTEASIRQAAAILGCSPSTVLRDRQRAPDYQPADDGTIPVRRVLGRDGKRRLNRRIDTTARDSRICELRDAGQSVRAIAGEVGCSVGTVHRVLKSAPSAGTVEAKQQQRTEWGRTAGPDSLVRRNRKAVKPGGQRRHRIHPHRRHVSAPGP